MTTALTTLLSFLSDSAAARVAASARRVAAIRLGARKHLCATLWSADVAVTCSPFLPEQDSYLLLLEDGHAVAHLAWRDETTGLAGLRLETPSPVAPCPLPRPVQTQAQAQGHAWLIAVGIDDTGAPAAGLVVPQAAPAGQPAEPSFGIDRTAGPGDFGGPLLAPSGALVGIIAASGAGGHGPVAARIIPYSEIARLVRQTHAAPSGPQPPSRQDDHSRAGRATASAKMETRQETPRKAAALRPGTLETAPRGWLGVGLQPTTVPRARRSLAGQDSGRKVVDIIPGGPAEQAGLLAGDIVLTIAGNTMVGSGAVREFLGLARVGETAEVRLLRDRELIRLTIVVSENPGG